LPSYFLQNLPAKAKKRVFSQNNHKFMKRIYTHTLLFFLLAFVYTKGSILSVFMYYIPLFSQLMIVGCFLAFLLFLAWLKRHEDQNSRQLSWKSVLKVAALGSVFGYILQLINIAVLSFCGLCFSLFIGGGSAASFYKKIVA
jgi:hypothetical protein